ncbi:MAG: FAD-dependent monooxygenase [Cytophagales bacterium]|nr:FAD-dependent monooxygenase [Bernardetiaceae bacterium]MDW8211501.1 FAD-dependent monooxygenase [Cytophagales bacterium]
MKKLIELTLPPEIAFDDEAFTQYIAQQPAWRQVWAEGKLSVRMLRRCIDGRAKNVKVHLTAALYIDQSPEPLIFYRKEYPQVNKAAQAIIVGAGPAGLFAGLRLIELGIKPVILERGSDVRTRRRDLAAINKHHQVNPESNYCFGEGGAGTYSDGKLYTRSKKRGNFRRILEIFVAHGASPDILVDNHPHIGTNKLPPIITAIRESILQAGGEIYFNTKVIDLVIEGDQVKGVRLHTGQIVEGIGVILATGHSARDIFELLSRRGIYIQFKPFALGVRVEHPQALIDSHQYHCQQRSEWLPAASYSLVTQVSHKGKTKGVFSFCMCPGGFIVPAATAPGEIVVNGMSPSRRNSRFANSGIVVAVDEQDVLPYQQYGALAGVAFQQAIEQRACQLAGGTQTAPAQRLMDFVEKKVSTSLIESSYQPGLASVAMDEVLPPQITYFLREGFKQFGKKMKGYLTNEAVVVGVESRTSSPVRIPRHSQTLEHLQVKRLFPCGEGAGYAGGIASAAMDGERCAEMLAALYGK